MLSLLATMDCLIVVGSKLDNHVSQQVIKKAGETGCLVIEVNPESILILKDVKKLIGDCNTVVPQLCKVIQETTEAYLALK